MPPKIQKKIDYKPDDSGIPKNEISFQFEFIIKPSTIQNFMILFEWFGQTSETIERQETPLIELWQPESDSLKYEKTFDLIRVDDDFVKNLTKKQFYIYFLNIEDNKVYQSFNLDYSCLISQKNTPKFTFTSTKLNIMEIENFNFTIKADKDLLTQAFRHYINPFEIEIIGAKELPDSSNNFLPVYARYEFYDGTKIETEKVPQNNTCKWNSKHVFLIGLMDQTNLKENLESIFLKVEIHDRDQIINENIKEETKVFDFQAQLDEEARKQKEKEEELLLLQTGKGAKGKPPPQKQEKKEIQKDPKKKEIKKKDFKVTDVILEEKPKLNINTTNFGVCTFLLSELLKPHIRNIKLRAPIVPNKKFEDVESKNLELNLTARKDIKKMMFSSSYLDNGSFCVLSFDMSFPIGTFIKPEMIEPEKNIKKPPSREQAKQVQTKIITEVSKEIKIEPPSNNIHEIYERAIYIFPYKCKEMTVLLHQTMNEINLKGLNIKEGGLRALTTYSLTEKEKKDDKLDYVSGFEIIDDEFRMFFFEGLSEKAMKTFEQNIPRKQPNSPEYKILKNPDIKFKERIYTEFNVSIKQIRLRKNLKEILLNPNIYLRTKVPENIMIVLNQLNNVRKQKNLRQIFECNLFPITEHLISLERKLSDSLSEEDILGYEPPPKSKKKELKHQETNEINEKNNQIDKNKIDLRRENSHQSDEITKSPLIKQKTQSFSKYEIRKSKSKIEEKEEIYIYSCQPKNYYAMQMDKLREKIRNDKKNFYTFSKDYLTLSIDPWTIEDKKKQENTLENSKIISSKMFRTLPKKNTNDYIHHDKKPPESTLDDIKENPWYVQHTNLLNVLKPNRGLPIQNDFKNYINMGSNKYFMDTEPEIKMTKAEKELFDKTASEKEKKMWKSKLIGGEYFYTLSRNPTKGDKYKGLLHDKANKKGLILNDKIIKESKISLAKTLEPLPSSMYSMDKWQPPLTLKELALKKDVHDDPSGLHKYQFDMTNKQDVLFCGPIAKITKKGVFD